MQPHRIMTEKLIPSVKLPASSSLPSDHPLDHPIHSNMLAFRTAKEIIQTFFLTSYCLEIPGYLIQQCVKTMTVIRISDTSCIWIARWTSVGVNLMFRNLFSW